jgi:hypothetical protein
MSRRLVLGAVSVVRVPGLPFRDSREAMAAQAVHD